MKIVRGYTTLEVRQRAVEAVLSGKSVASVASFYGVGRMSVNRWVNRYKEAGEVGLLRRKSPGSGRPKLLASICPSEFEKMLALGARHYGYSSDLWTAKRLVKAMKKTFSIAVSTDTILRRLHDAGFTYQRPEKYFAEIDDEKRLRWRRYELPKIRRCVAANQAILYFEDEAHVAMSTVLGKTWSPKGCTPKIKSSGQRGGVSAMSSISQRGYLLFRVVRGRIASPQVISFLKQMLAHHKRRHLVVVMDQARLHVSKMTRDYIGAVA